MKKSVTKIVKAVLGFAVAIGAGVGAGGSSQKESPVCATETPDSTQTITITRSNFGSGSNYSIAGFSQTTSGGSSVSGYGQINLTTDNSMQFNKGQGVGAIWNSTPVPGAITSISAKTASGTNRTWNAWVSSTAYCYSDNTFTAGNDATKLNKSAVTVTTSQTTIGVSSHGYSYFALIENVSNASYLENITITYIASGKGIVELSCDDLELDVSDSPQALNISAESEGNAVLGLSYSFEVKDTTVATVSNSGVVTAVEIGETKLTIYSARNANYYEAFTTINVSVSHNSLSVSNMTFTAACGGSGEANDGAAWTITSDGNESSFDNTNGIHYATNDTYATYLQLVTSDIFGDIKQVVVTTKDTQAKAAVSVTVGATAFTYFGSSTVTATNNSDSYAFRGNARGEITIRIDRGESMKKALYVKSIVVYFDKITLSSIALSGAYQTTFDQGGEFNHDGMVVTATFSDTTTSDVTSQSRWTGYNLANSGPQTVIVTYKNKTATYSITVNSSIMYTVDGAISNGSLSSTESVSENSALNITINADSRYVIPASLTVTMGGNNLSIGTGYSYDSTTGAFSIASVTGNVVINGSCIKKHGCWAEDPYTVAEAIVAIDSGVGINGVYAAGVVSEIVTPYNSQYGNISYNISANGSMLLDQLQAYRGKSFNGDNFTSEDNIKVGASVVVYGDLTKHDTIYEFSANNQLALYDSPSNEEQLSAYLSSSVSITKIHGTAEHKTSDTGSETITFADLSLTNGVQYLDPFNGGHFTIEFAGGANDGKYYDTGSGIRTYDNGTITIASTENITEIQFVWSSNSYKPTVATVVDEGTYDVSTGFWAGNNNSIILTKPTGGEAWRLQSITVTYGLVDSVDDLVVRFGVSIPTSCWDGINNNANLEITDYGVMMFRTTEADLASAPTVENYYRANANNVAISRKGSGVKPTAANGKYTFTAKISITDTANYNIYFCAQAFVVINGTDYYFIGEEMQGSVRTIAQNNSETNLSRLALRYLSGN